MARAMRQIGPSLEEIQLQKAIEESKNSGPMNPDNMSYEQLLELEERIGKVSKGMTPEEIAKIPNKKFTLRMVQTEADAQCSICVEELTTGDNCK